ncbi:hypothetical protein BK731_07480 [Bacillus thuringiensis serovar muju]|nr:hypothetical protein BK731_07480 [Bacillus thuringiensis serovar muju]
MRFPSYGNGIRKGVRQEFLFFLSHLKKSLFIHLTLARCQYLYKKAVISDFGRKSHRYEKKTVFDILGVVYEYTTSNPQVA